MCIRDRLYIVTYQAQNLSQLKKLQADKIGSIADFQAQIDAVQGELDAIEDEIDRLSGWRKGITGIIGYDLMRANGWVANPIPNSRAASLNIGLSGYLLRDTEKTFWYNTVSVVKAWNDVDISVDEMDDDIGLFDNSILDNLNLSSHAGYKLSDKLAISAQAELNTSIHNFLEPATLDLGLGITWFPIQNLTVLVHPLNYNIAFPPESGDLIGLETSGSVGAKVRADYYNNFKILSKNVNWTSSFTAYFPYTSIDDIIIDGTTFSPEVNYYTWLNSFSFEIWKGVGVGIGWGLREADFESNDFQSYYNLGLSYNIN